MIFNYEIKWHGFYFKDCTSVDCRVKEREFVKLIHFRSYFYVMILHYYSLLSLIAIIILLVA